MLQPIGFPAPIPGTTPQRAASDSRPPLETGPVDVVISGGAPQRKTRVPLAETELRAHAPGTWMADLPAALPTQGPDLSRVPDWVLQRITSPYGRSTPAERLAALHTVAADVPEATSRTFESWAMASDNLREGETLGQLAEEFCLLHALAQKRGEDLGAIGYEFLPALRYSLAPEHRRPGLQLALHTGAHPREVGKLLEELKPTPDELPLPTMLSPRLERVGPLLRHLRKTKTATPEGAARAAHLDPLVPDKVMDQSLKAATGLDKPEQLKLLAEVMKRAESAHVGRKVYQVLEGPSEAPLAERLALYDRLFEAAIPRKVMGSPLGAYGALEAAASDYTLITDSLRPGETLDHAYQRYRQLFEELGKGQEIYSLNFDEARKLKLLHEDRAERYLHFRKHSVNPKSGVEASLLLEKELQAPERRGTVDALLAGGLRPDSVRRCLPLVEADHPAPLADRLEWMLYAHRGLEDDFGVQAGFKLLAQAGPDRPAVRAYFEQQMEAVNSQPSWRRHYLGQDLLASWRHRFEGESLPEAHARFEHLQLGNASDRLPLFEWLGARATPSALSVLSQCYQWASWKRDKTQELFETVGKRHAACYTRLFDQLEGLPCVARPRFRLPRMEGARARPGRARPALRALLPGDAARLELGRVGQ